MKLEDQVVSLELAKRLKELGVKQESLFTWYEWYENEMILFHDRSPEISGQNPYSAFTIAELVEILPKNIPFTLVKNNQNYYVISGLTKHEPQTD
jgi:hypothetical protein